MPGAGSGGTWMLSATRWAASSRWVFGAFTCSRWVSTMAPIAAVISSAPVTSKAHTYLVKISRARPWTLPSALASPRPAKVSSLALAIPATISTPKPRPQSAAANRWPFNCSFSESALVTPTSITTNRKSIMIAPV